MFLNDLENEIENYFIAGITPKIMGASGIGKSDFFRGLIQKYSQRDGQEWGFGEMFPAIYTPIDVNGYMIPVDDGKGGKVSMFTTPPWMFDTRSGKALNEYHKAILLIDEADKGDPDVKKAIAELVLHKRVGRHQLGPNVYVVQCANERKHRSGSTKDFDFVINREGWVQVEPGFAPWERWALNNDIPPIFIMFADKHRNTIFSGEHPKEQGPWCTPRSYVNAVRLIMARDVNLTSQGKEVIPNYGANDREASAILQLQCKGIMGDAATTELFTWLKIRLVTPDFKDILANPDTCVIPDAPDAKLLTTYECSYNVTYETVSQVLKYIKRFTPEFHITFFRGISRRKNILVAHPEVMAFIKQNSALMNAIG